VDESKLKTIGLFAGLSRGELQRLSSVTDEIVVPAGTSLIHEGTFAHEFLVIEAGSAEVRRGGEPLARLIRQKGHDLIQFARCNQLVINRIGPHAVFLRRAASATASKICM